MKKSKVIGVITFIVVGIAVTICTEYINSKFDKPEELNYFEKIEKEKKEKEEFLAPRKEGNYKGWSDSEIKELKQTLIKDVSVISKCKEFNVSSELFVECYVDKIVYRFSKKDVLYVDKPSSYVEKELLKYGDECLLDLMNKKPN